MARLTDRPAVEVSIDIAAPTSEVWALVTDINLPARFQDEFRGGEWLDEGPALRARFVGRNQRGDWKWETTSWVVTYEPERAFGWAVSDPDDPGSIWTFRLEATDMGTRLTYHRSLEPGPSGITSSIERNPDRETEIIESRNAEQRENMRMTIEGIKTLAEGV
ncbi:MAG: SRPBCC family protein [Acidimicrobiia bacterium]|nr:SRPBCC family protein [Acidimicrobiia bacterium]NNC75993.1 SRPBCC family protein [Acidimicrobiia bacterium]